MSNKILIDDLYYKREINEEYIFKDLNLNIELQKGLVFILGPSGMGKSTLLHLINGLLKIDKGEIIINGKNLSTIKAKGINDYWSETCSLMYQNFPLINWLTCKENLTLISNNEELIKEIAQRLNVYNILNDFPDHISFGQRQRIALIQTFLLKTNIKLLDEPTSALGKDDKFLVMKLIKEIALDFNSLFIIATHDQELVKFANEIYSIEDKSLKKFSI